MASVRPNLTVGQVRKNNKEEVLRFKEYLELMPKVATIYAADAAMAVVVSPATGNGRRAEGHRTVHDSSNAAWNWRVSINGAKLPATDTKGKSPVGSAGDKRSTNNMSAAQEVVKLRRKIDINDKLYKHLFTGKEDLKSIDVSIYNNINRHSVYAYNASLQLAAESDELKSNMHSAQSAAKAVLNEHMRSGKDQGPATQGLRMSLAVSSNSNFINWM